MAEDKWPQRKHLPHYHGIDRHNQAVIFFVTSTFFLSTPGTLTHVHGFSYMSDLGLFLFKDIISLGANLYFISYYSKKIQP